MRQRRQVTIIFGLVPPATVNTTAGPTPSPRASQRQREHQNASIILTDNAAIMLIVNAGQQAGGRSALVPPALFSDQAD